MIWDHVGGMLLFQEAGGNITDLDGKDIDLSHGRNFRTSDSLQRHPKSMPGSKEIN